VSALKQFTLPPDNRQVGQPNPPLDMDSAVDAIIALGAMQSALNTGNAGGADPNGVTDSTAAITAALATATGLCLLPPGDFLCDSSQIAAAVAGGKVKGMGYGLTTLVIGSGFTGSSVLAAGANSVEFADLAIVGANSTVTSNPAANGIEISGGWEHCRIRNVWMQYVNGWGIEAVGGSSQFNADLIGDGIVMRNCAGGIHDKGVSGSSYQGEHFWSNIQLQQIGASSGASANLDAMRIEDIADIVTSNINVGVVAGTGSAVNLLGKVTSAYFVNPDLGGGTPVVILQAGANGSPTDIRFSNGNIQESTSGPNLIVSGASSEVFFTNIYLHASNTTSCALSNTGGPCAMIGCQWNTSNQSDAATAYDADFTSATAKWDVIGGNFRTTVGTSAAQVTAPVNDPSGVATFIGTRFSGTGTTTSNFGAVSYYAVSIINVAGISSSVPGNPMSTLGDTVYGGASGVMTRLGANTAATKKFLTETGTGSAGAAPAWSVLASGDIPNNAASTSGTAAGLSSTLAVASGGTGQITLQAALNALAGAVTSGEFLRGNGTNVLLAAIAAADLPTGTTSTQGALQLDGTAGDIQPAAQSAAAGSSGKAPDAKHVHPPGSSFLVTPSQYAPSAQTSVTTTSTSMAPLTGAASTVAAGSNGGEISQIATWGAGFGGNGVLDIANGTLFPADGGTVTVAASGPTTAIVTYTGVSGNTLTGCAYVSGSATGTVSTGGAVTLTSAAASTGSFAAPASGSVVVTVSFVGGINANAGFAFGLCAHNTVTPMVCPNAVFDQSSASLNPTAYSLQFLVTGLTPGTSYNFDLMGSVTSGDTLTILAMASTATSPTFTSGGRGAPVLMTVEAV
jgi:hypothetical protein